MSKKKERLENTVSQALGDKEEELYLLRWEKRGSKWVLEVLIDKSGPVTTADCADASRRISSGLDGSGLIDRKYELQVSSP
ncbi:ribosome maturation factor RimP, partial [Candidatus Bipolaricaulota bacterium]|nr:ribosome maturation factor RimP [Candidatus Bipolaricaulota bacterium]